MWKNFDEVSYDNYVTFTNQDWFTNISNLHIIIKSFAKHKLTDEEVLKMNMEDVMTGFFFAQKHTKKSLHSMIQHLRIQLIKQAVKDKLNRIPFKRK